MSSTQVMVNAKWQKWILITGKLLLCITLALILAKLFWQIVAPPILYLQPPSQANGNQNQQFGQPLNTADYHLFGEAGKQVVETKEVDAPDTRLNLELLGITVGRSQEESSAIIAIQNGEASFYRVDDKVLGRTVLSAVYADKVILNTNGNLETLKFDEQARVGVSAKAIDRKPLPVRRITSPSAIREQYRNVATPAEFLDVTQQIAEADPMGMINQLGVKSLGSGQGYQVQSDSMLQTLNLRPGDVVLSVNGQRLGDLETDKMILKEMSSAGSVRLEIQRNNQRFVINHQM